MNLSIMEKVLFAWQLPLQLIGLQSDSLKTNIAILMNSDIQIETGLR